MCGKVNEDVQAPRGDFCGGPATPKESANQGMHGDKRETVRDVVGCCHPRWRVGPVIGDQRVAQLAGADDPGGIGQVKRNIRRKAGDNDGFEPMSVRVTSRCVIGSIA